MVKVVVKLCLHREYFRRENKTQTTEVIMTFDMSSLIINNLISDKCKTVHPDNSLDGRTV